MKITKKSFIENLTQNNSYFLGITKRLCTKDEVYCKISDLLNDNNIFVNVRSCIAKSNYILFNDNSRLEFNQTGAYTFYKYEYNNAFVLVHVHSYIDEFDNTEYQKVLYYFIKK